MKITEKIAAMNKEISIKQYERDLEIWKGWWPVRMDPDLYDDLLKVIDRLEDVINNPALAQLISDSIEHVFEKGHVTEDWIASGIKEFEKL